MVSCMENHSFFESSAAGRSRKMGMAPTPIPRTVHKSSTPPARDVPPEDGGGAANGRRQKLLGENGKGQPPPGHPHGAHQGEGSSLPAHGEVARQKARRPGRPGAGGDEELGTADVRLQRVHRFQVLAVVHRHGVHENGGAPRGIHGAEGSGSCLGQGGELPVVPGEKGHGITAQGLGDVLHQPFGTRPGEKDLCPCSQVEARHGARICMALAVAKGIHHLEGEGSALPKLLIKCLRYQ